MYIQVYMDHLLNTGNFVLLLETLVNHQSKRCIYVHAYLPRQQCVHDQSKISVLLHFIISSKTRFIRVCICFGSVYMSGEKQL